MLILFHEMHTVQRQGNMSDWSYFTMWRWSIRIMSKCRNVFGTVLS